MAFDLNAYLAERKQRIEAALFAALPDGNRCRQPLADAMAHALKAGGKRLRPILCLAAAESVGGDSEPVMPVACAVEILHNYTLVHDDLPCMDNDTLRRGQPTVWYRFGEGIGVLAGDALLTFAFEWLATFPESRVGVTAALVGELERRIAACDTVLFLDVPEEVCMEGITGRVARVNRQNRVVVSNKGLQSGLTTAYIPPHCLEKI